VASWADQLGNAIRARIVRSSASHRVRRFRWLPRSATAPTLGTVLDFGWCRPAVTGGFQTTPAPQVVRKL
jgi:hypothetical protein